MKWWVEHEPSPKNDSFMTWWTWSLRRMQLPVAAKNSSCQQVTIWEFTWQSSYQLTSPLPFGFSVCKVVITLLTYPNSHYLSWGRLQTSWKKKKKIWALRTLNQLCKYDSFQNTPNFIFKFLFKILYSPWSCLLVLLPPFCQLDFNISHKSTVTACLWMGRKMSANKHKNSRSFCAWK